MKMFKKHRKFSMPEIFRFVIEFITFFVIIVSKGEMYASVFSMKISLSKIKQPKMTSIVLISLLIFLRKLSTEFVMNFLLKSLNSIVLFLFCKPTISLFNLRFLTFCLRLSFCLICYSKMSKYCMTFELLEFFTFEFDFF